MTTDTRPEIRPANPPVFSSGPCAKRPGWTPEALSDAALGRSHRARIGKSKLKQAIDLTREVLGVPDDYRIGIVPASDTGAVEMAMWSMLGARGVDMVRLGELWRRLGHRRGQAAQAHRHAQDPCPLRRTAGPDPDRFRPRRGLHLERQPPRACGFRTLISSPPTAKGSPSATPPPRPLRRISTFPSSMSRPSPGRRCWAARGPTAC